MAEDGLELEESDSDSDIKEYAPDFQEYAKRELDISGKPDDVYADACPWEDDDDYFWRGIRWVFWSRQDYDDNFVGSISDALHKIILDPCLQDALVQFWAPTKTLEGRTLLTTQHQPFALAKTYLPDDRRRLCEYRMEMCREYNDCFYADAGSGEDQLGVPGRVFLHKSPELIADVQNYSLKDCPQRDLALRCGIRGYLALPVFQRFSQTCIGVLEISMLYPSQALYGYEKDFLRHVFDRFQEFGLQCIYGCKDCEMRDEDKNKALAVAFKELETVLKSVCEIHKLPLAMTWVPCSTCDHLFRGQHLLHCEGRIWRNKMIETRHLRKGQVTGRICTFPKLSYCSDVKQFSIAEQPMVTHVRGWKLSGCFTMCLQSSWTGSELYVLEFFLPPISKDGENILTRLSLISRILRTVEENSQNFKLACSQEFGGGLTVEVIDFSNGQRSHSIQMLQLDQPDQPSMDAVNSHQWKSVEPLQNGKVATQLDSSDQSSMDPANNGQDVSPANNGQDVSTAKEERRKRKQNEANILEVTSSEESKRETHKGRKRS